MKISAVWIVLNEERNILKSIKSVENMVDEIIVVDTGSTDNTIDILHKANIRTNTRTNTRENIRATTPATIHVAFFQWTDDFSAARNYALNLATGDIVLFLDADEYFERPLTRKDKIEIVDMFEKNPRLDGILLFLHNVNKLGKRTHIAHNLRILRRNECRFQGAIHEMYLQCDGKSPVSCFTNKWQIIHTGYDDDLVPFKRSRNIRILEAAVNSEMAPLEKHRYYCYLIRELSNNKMYNDALIYLNSILAAPHYLIDILVLMKSSFVSSFYAMINTSIIMRDYVNRLEIKHKIVTIFKQNLPDYPGSATIDLFFEAGFELDEARLLRQIDAALIVSDRKSENANETSYLEAEYYICIKAAQAALARNDYNASLKYALQAKYRSTKYEPQIVFIILSSLKDIPSAEVISLLNDCYDINDPEILKHLTTDTFKINFKEVYIYYLELCIKKSIGSPWDIFFYTLINAGYKEAVKCSKKYYNTATAESAAKIIMLSSFIYEDKKLFYENKEILANYIDILDAHFNNMSLKMNHNHVQIFTEFYPIIAFVAGLDRANEFAALFTAFEQIVSLRRVSYYAENGLLALLVSAYKNMLPGNSSFASMLLKALIRLGRFNDAFLMIKDDLEQGKINHDYLNCLLILCEQSDKSIDGSIDRSINRSIDESINRGIDGSVNGSINRNIKREAKYLYKKYKSVYNRFIDLRDMLRTGYFMPDKDIKKEKMLKSMTFEKLQKNVLLKADTPNIPTLLTVSIDAAHFLEANNMPIMAFDCLTLAHQCNKKRYEVYQGMARLLHRIGNTQLSNDLSQKLASQMTNLHQKCFDVVFLTYKASMWDSLESIWFAAKQDPLCNTHVIAIPYYDRLPNGNFGEMHYEGNQYPSYVPIENWQTYAIKERKPEIIFTHNPYDEFNRTTSVHPDFYCSTLKSPDSLLIYVPYYVVIAPCDQTENLCIHPGTQYADYVFVQSDEIRDVYIKAYNKAYNEPYKQSHNQTHKQSHNQSHDQTYNQTHNQLHDQTHKHSHNKTYSQHVAVNNYPDEFGKATEKFISVGSPKFDKVRASKDMDFTIPLAWEKAIETPTGRKKIILYNTTLIGILNGKESHLHKICSVLTYFSKRDDIILWWRPHPLSEATYAAMFPALHEEYKRIVNQYKQDGYGIFDDTADINRAIALSDAYYGDYSSVIAMFNLTGKPILQQNPGVLSQNTDALSQNTDALSQNTDAILEQKYFYHYEKNEIDVERWLKNYVLCTDINQQKSFDKSDVTTVSAGEVIYNYVKSKRYTVSEFNI